MKQGLQTALFDELMRSERTECVFSRVEYQFCFERHSFGWWLRLIIPAILLNSIGFASFWMSSAGESVALGITTLLCTLALRDSLDLPETTNLSWVELFMTLNIAYQSAVMLLGEAQSVGPL